MESRSINQKAVPTSYVRYIDWVSVGIYLLLIVAGVFSVYGAG